jgi:hypothetical protein
MGFKLFEKTLLIACAVAIIFKLLQIPFWISFCILSLSILGLSYMAAGWYLFSVKENEATQNSLPFSIVSGFVLMQLALGILFKLCSWPGYEALLYGGLFFSIILLVLSFIIRLNSNVKPYYSLMIKRLLIIISVGILIIPLQVKHYHYTHNGKRIENIDSSTSH